MKIFALTDTSELVYFHVKTSAKNQDAFECRILATLTAKELEGVTDLTVVRGGLIWQRGRMLYNLDSSAQSLRQTPILSQWQLQKPTIDSPAPVRQTRIGGGLGDHLLVRVDAKTL